jgi:hypothetical protein
MKTLYKILFEVKLFHEFYLTDPQGNSIFDLAVSTDRMNFLLGRFNADLNSVNEDLLFELTPDQQILFRNYRLVLLNSYSGFQVAAQVNESILTDGTLAYTPLIAPGNSLSMVIGMREARSFIDQITNGRLKRPVKGAWYFSNEKLFDPKAFPVLSSPIQAPVPGYVYEQGELASYGPGDIRAYYYYNIGNPPVKDQWLPISGDGFSNEQDRLVVLPRFFYAFSTDDKVSNANFQLKDSNGQPIDTRNFSNPTPLSQVLLDYSALLNQSSQPNLNTLPRTPAGSTLLYTLNVSGDNGYSRQVPLLFYQPDPDSAPVDYWGWVQIKTAVSNTDFNLLDAAGMLLTRRKPDGTQVPHPVFEIRMKSRCNFWRYKNDEGSLLNLTPDTTDFLDLLNGQLVSKTPRFTTYMPLYFHKTSDNTYHFLPNPDPGSITEIDTQQFFSNIPVPESTLFPIT